MTSPSKPDSDVDKDNNTSTRFFPTLDQVPTAFADLLEQYSHIPPPDQIQHIVNLRDRAYEAHPYPCLGRFRFLTLSLSSHPLYHDHVLTPLKTTPTEGDEPLLLDLGTCLGQDLRKLILDGVSASCLIGSDILPSFIDIGYDLFQDRDKLPRETHFLAPADIFDDSFSNPLDNLKGRVTVLHVSAVFHLFLLPKQRALARRCLRLLKPFVTTTNDDGGGGITIGDNNDKGNNGGTTATGTPTGPKRRLILGGQTANLTAGEYPRVNRDETRSMRYRHNADSWRELWEGAVEEMKEEIGCTSVKVESRLGLSRHHWEEGQWGQTERKGVRQQERTERNEEGQQRSGTLTQEQGNGGQQSEQAPEGEAGSASSFLPVGNKTSHEEEEEGFRWAVWWVWVYF